MIFYVYIEYDVTIFDDFWAAELAVPTGNFARLLIPEG